MNEFPIVSFDYRFHPKLPIELLLKTGRHGWKGILLAGDEVPLYERLAEPVGLRADDEWHHAQLSLRRILENAYPSEDDWRIEELRFQSWKKPAFKRLELGTSFADFHVYYDLARFCLFRYASGTKVHLKWSADDPNGIAGYSTVLDQSPWTVPPPLKEPQVEPEKTFEDVKPGTWFFHVRAVDGPGNWGKTAHYELRINAGKPGTLVFKGPESQRLRWPEPTEVRAADGSRLIPESLKLNVAGRSFTTADAALDFEPSTGKLSFHPDLVEPLAWLLPDGVEFPVIIEEALAFDGASLPEPVTFTLAYQSPLKLEPDAKGQAASLVPVPSTPVARATLPSMWFQSPPRIRVADAPEGSSFRWRAQPEAQGKGDPDIQSLELRLPVSWFSERAQLKNRGQDFVPCVWSFGLASDGIRDKAAVWTPGGLLGTYFKSESKEPLTQRLDPSVFYSLNDASSLPVIPQVSSARWEGMLYVPFTDEWSFEFRLNTTKVKAELVLKGETVLTTEHQWHPHVISGRRFLARGFYPIRIEIESPTPSWHLDWSWEAEDWRALRRVPPENLFARLPLGWEGGRH